MGSRTRHRHRGLGALAGLAVAMLLAAPALAQEELETTLVLDGREASGLDVNDPLLLDADEPLEVRAGVANTTGEDLFVRSVRLRSNVMGLTFLAYETRIDLPVPAGASEEVAFELDLLDLRSQATGLLPAEVELLDTDREAVASVPVTVDVQGSLASVYGAFGLTLMVLTVVTLALGLFRLASGRLPANRWSRALQFAAPGLGVGLVLTIGLSTLRIFSPAPGVWSTLLIVCGAIGFALGYLSPSPSREEVLEVSDVDVAVGATEGAGTPGADNGQPGRSSRSTVPGQKPPATPDR